MSELRRRLAHENAILRESLLRGEEPVLTLSPTEKYIAKSSDDAVLRALWNHWLLLSQVRVPLNKTLRSWVERTKVHADLGLAPD